MDLFGAADGGAVVGSEDAANRGDTGSDGSTEGIDGGVDGAPGTRTTEIRCGTSACSIPAQSCCVDFSEGPPQQLAFACVNGSDCPVSDSGATVGQPTVSLKCGGAVNCPTGTVCCITKIQNTISARCTPVCGTGEAQLCEPDAIASGCSTASGTCSNANIKSWGLPISYGTCGGVAAQ